jgi:hypothetical protein
MIEPYTVYQSDNSIVAVSKITRYGTIYGVSYGVNGVKEFQIGEEHINHSNWVKIGTPEEYPEYFL